MNVSLVGLQCGGVGFDGNLIGDLAERQFYRDADNAVDGDTDALPADGAKALSGDFQIIVAGLNVLEGVAAFRIGGEITGLSRAGVGDGNGGLGHSRSGLIGDCSDQRTIENLR